MPEEAVPAFVVTCEHAGNRVPPGYAHLFEGAEALLASHRGWDPGAGALARSLARRLRAPLAITTVTRLLVEVNRTEGHPRVFSELARPLSGAEREAVLARWYRPYRRRVRALVERQGAGGRPVVHASAHSFTPVLDGEVRDVDVGFLYDPSRAFERAVVERWVAALTARAPHLRVRRNRPYLGTSDGLTRTLRGLFPDGAYAGIEIEVNQAITTGPPAAWRALRGVLGDVCASAARRGR